MYKLSIHFIGIVIYRILYKFVYFVYLFMGVSDRLRALIKTHMLINIPTHTHIGVDTTVSEVWPKTEIGYEVLLQNIQSIDLIQNLGVKRSDVLLS